MNAPILLDTKPQGVVLSASQIGRYDDCKRWWAWEYIEKIRSPPHPSAELGSRVHTHLEAWLRDATPPAPRDNSPFETKAAAIAKRMITTLIKNGVTPGTGAVERRFWIRSARGLLYTGFIDWSGVLSDIATVTDHKTSGNLNWAKTEADLHNDIQAVLYAVAAFIGFGTDAVQLFWNYGETKNPERATTRAVKTVVHLPVVAQKFAVIEETAAEMVAHRNANTPPLSFPPSPSSCGNYGGCPHRGRCNLNDQEMLGGLMDNGQGQGPSMAERMAAATATPGGPLPPQQPVVTQAQTMPQQPQQPQPVMPQQPQPALPQAPTQPQGFAPPPPEMQPTVEGAVPPMGMLPPQQPQQPQQPYAPEIAPNAPETGVEVPPPGPSIAPPTTSAKAGPGRPAGSKNTKKTLTVDQQVFLAAMQGAVGNPNFNGTVELLTQAGNAALEAFKAKFPK
jgi:hypothetical protein